MKSAGLLATHSPQEEVRKACGWEVRRTGDQLEASPPYPRKPVLAEEQNFTNGSPPPLEEQGGEEEVAMGGSGGFCNGFAAGVDQAGLCQSPGAAKQKRERREAESGPGGGLSTEEAFRREGRMVGRSQGRLFAIMFHCGVNFDTRTAGWGGEAEGETCGGAKRQVASVPRAK